MRERWFEDKRRDGLHLWGWKRGNEGEGRVRRREEGRQRRGVSEVMKEELIGG